MRRWILLLILLLCSLQLGAVFSETITTELYVGQMLELQSKIVDQTGIEVDDDIDWSSSDSKIASVKNGVITAKAKGEAVITANVDEGASLQSFKVFITVKTTVHSVELSIPKDEIYIGEYMQSSAIVKPVNNLTVDVNDAVEYSSSDKDVFTVDDNGIVQGVGTGTAYLRVETVDGERPDSKKITVKNMVKSVEIDQEPFKLYVGEKQALSTTVYPQNAFNKNIDWESSSHVTVDKNGLVTGKNPGFGFVTATTEDGAKTDTLKVEVISMVDSVEIIDENIIIDDDHPTYQLTAILHEKFPGMPPIEDDIDWETSLSHVATVSSSGLVTGKHNGYVTITATSDDGRHTDTIKIQVKFTGKNDVPPESIKFENSTDWAYAGETLYFSYAIEPTNTTEDDVDIDFYGGDGKLSKGEGYVEFTPYDEGQYTIALETENDIKTSTTFKVISNIEDVTIDHSELVKSETSGRYIIYLGQTGKLDYSLTQSSAATSIIMDDVSWSSSNKDVVKIKSDGSFEGLEEGVSNIMVKTLDSNHTDFINLEVVGMAESVELPSYAEVGLNVNYLPSPFFKAKEGLHYNYTEVLNRDFDMEITKIYVPREFLESEKDYEYDRQKRLKDLIDSKFGDVEEHMDELSDSKSRVVTLRAFLDADGGDYVRVNYKDRELTDRNFDELDIAEVDGHGFNASIICKAEVEIVTEDGELEDTMTIFSDAEVTKFLVFDEKGNLLIHNEGIDSDTVSDETQAAKDSTEDQLDEQQATQTESLKSNYSHMSPMKAPSDETIISVEEARAYGFVQSSFEIDYRRGITRLEMTKLCMDIVDHYTGESGAGTAYSIYLDTDDVSANRAFQYGIVSITGERLFKPYEIVSREEMTHMFFKTLLALDKELSSELSPKRSTYFTDESSIGAEYRQAVGYMCYDHTTIGGITDSMFWPQTKAQIDYVLMYAMNIIKAIPQ